MSDTSDFQSGSSIEGSLDAGHPSTSQLPRNSLGYFDIPDSEGDSLDSDHFATKSVEIEASSPDDGDEADHIVSAEDLLAHESTHGDSDLPQHDLFATSGNNDEQLLASLLPSCLRISSMLTELGYSPIQLTPQDINIAQRSMSVFIVDAWSESILSCIADLSDLHHRHTSTLHHMTERAQLSDVSQESLEEKNKHLDTKLETLQRKLALAQQRCAKLEQEKEQLSSKLKSQEMSHKRQAKNTEAIIQEHERRYRVKEAEVNKLKDKLRTMHEAKGTDRASPGKGKQQRSSDVEAENTVLRRHVKDLESQIVSLQDQLKHAMNGTLPHEVMETKEKDDDADKRLLYDQIKEQSLQIKQLNHKLELECSKNRTAEDNIQLLKERAQDMRNEIDNLRLEVDSRPSMPQWNQKLKEIRELESKLHDVVVLRQESKELLAWKKHLSTRDQIKADRRNHELGLWVLESLPSSVMREALMSLCRELDVNDISELLPCVTKLKTVVRAVPRMQAFITSVCDYVFQRSETDGKQSAEHRPVMEDVLGILQNWWAHVNSGQEVLRFQQRLFELLNSHNFFDGSSPSVDKAALALEKIGNLIDFQAEIFQNKEFYQNADKFVSTRPDVLVNSIIVHLQYLFGISSLDGIIPRMNQVYLFLEEMRNFMVQMRQSLQMESLPDATVLTEIQRRVQAQGDKQ